MNTHKSVYVELRPVYLKVMQKAGEYLNIQLRGIDDSVKLCSHEGKYKTMPLRFRSPDLIELFKPYIQECKLESNKYYKCSIKDWSGFLEFVKKHSQLTDIPKISTKKKKQSVNHEKPITRLKKQIRDDLPMASIIKLFCRIINCRDCIGMDRILCDNQFNLPQPGYIGVNYPKRKILLIAQNPGICKSYHKLFPQAKKYADLILTFQKSPDKNSFYDLNNFLADFIPQWPIYQKFPGSEAGIFIEDIAYINLVHCRTKDNQPVPKQATYNCIEAHFEMVLDLLQPKVAIVLGKHPYMFIKDILDRRNIPNGYINRLRNLPSEERENNRAEIIELLKD